VLFCAGGERLQHILEPEPNPKQKIGELLLQNGFAKEAHPYLLRDFDPKDYRRWANLAVCNRILGNLDEAKENAKKSLDLNKYAPRTWHNLTLIMEDLGQFDHAQEAADIAYQLLPVDKEIAYRLAMTHMRNGDWTSTKVTDAFEFGREEFFWQPYRGIVKWRGEPLAGKRVLVLREGGYGDCFWFMRYLKLLKEQDCHVTYISWKKQKAIFEPFVDKVLSCDDMLNETEYDYQIALWSLSSLHPGPLSMTQPYLYAKRMSIPKTGFTVGIAWSALECEVPRKTRGIPMLALEPLQSVAVNWTALSVDDEIPSWCSDPRAVLWQGWESTMTVIDRCDLVITSDSVVGHMAGGMGKETWLLLPKNCDGRWGSPEHCMVKTWYPSTRPIRNPDPLSWDGLIASVKTELENRLALVGV